MQLWWHTYNPSTQEAELVDHEFETSLGYIGTMEGGRERGRGRGREKERERDEKREREGEGERERERKTEIERERES
jgi:hypothetical protein